MSVEFGTARVQYMTDLAMQCRTYVERVAHPKRCGRGRKAHTALNQSFGHRPVSNGYFSSDKQCNKIYMTGRSLM